MEKEQCICMYIYMYVYTERFTTMLRRCGYRPSCIDFRVPSLGKVKQWRCRDINLNHLSWIWPCCCAFPLATVFRPSMIHPSCLRQCVVAWGLCSSFCRYTPCRSRSCFSVKQSELTGLPLIWLALQFKNIWSGMRSNRPEELKWERETKGDQAEIFLGV